MKLIAVLVGAAVSLVISSCATAPKPLASGELRLSSVRLPEKEDIKVNTPFLVAISFEADGEPDIRAACFYFSGDGPYCSKVTDVIYGSPGMIKVETRTRYSGSFHLGCYVRYIRDGKMQETNEVGSHFHASTQGTFQPTPKR